ncbi:MAG: transglycosylase domain-containing protein [Pseudomonadota bacterium]
MISAALRLALIVGLLWWLARQFPGFEVWLARGLENFIQLFGLPQALGVLLGLTLFLTLARLMLLPFWIARVRLDAGRALLQHAFPRQPLRIQLRFRRSRFLLFVLCDLWLLIAAWKALAVLPAPPRVIELPGLGSGDWLDAALGQALVQVAVLLVFTGLHWLGERAAEASAGSVGFLRYQIDETPVRRFLVRYVLGVQMPVLMVFSAWAPHPMAPLLGLAATFGVGFVSLPAALLTRALERRRDRWLERVHRGDVAPPGPTPARELVARTVAFLQPGHIEVAALAAGTSLIPTVRFTPVQPAPEVASAPDDATRDPSSDLSPSDEFDISAEMPDELSEAEVYHPDTEPLARRYDEEPSTGSVAREALNRARALLAAGRLRAARAALRQAIAVGDDAERREAQALLKPAGGGFPWRFALTGVVLASAALLVVIGWQWLELPSTDETRALARSAHVHVRKSTADDGSARLSLLGNRYDYSLNTSLDNISEHFINAVIASEDHRFFEHSPDYMIAKFIQAGLFCVARKLNVFSSATGCAGNSTITQQLARNLFLSESRSIVRKLKELLWAIKMELGMDKREILALYLNRLYLGRGNFGVELGARDYFNKSASRLTRDEAAFLAAAIKRPGWNWRENRSGAIRRATLIVALMRRHGYAPEGARFPANFVPRFGKRPPYKPYLGHLWQWIRADVARALSPLPDGDYKVLTSLNAELEIYAERHLAKQVRALQRAGIAASQGAAVIMRPDGRVLAMVGGVGSDVKARGANRAKRTAGLLSRPPASSFKPFVYLSALESGLSPESRISAAPVSIRVPGDPNPYRPQNHDGKVYGDVTMREGLVRSINTAAVRLLHDELKFDRLFDTLKRLGLRTTDMPRQWGLALGSAGVPLVEMTTAYAVLANGGASVAAHGFTAITTETGRVVWRAPKPRGRRMFAGRHVQDLTSMLRDVVRLGTGRRAIQGLPAELRVAGKTGTGDNFVDAWFIGYTADIVIGVWVGNDRPRSMPGVYGGTAPARAFNDMLTDIVRHTSVLDETAGRPRITPHGDAVFARAH